MPETETGTRIDGSSKTAPTDHPGGDPRFNLVDRTIERFAFQRDSLLEVLNTAQEAFGFLSEDLLRYVSGKLKVPLSRVFGVATFYHMFTFKPLGEHTCIVCLGTACYVKGAEEILETLSKEFHLKAGSTTPNGKLSLAVAHCPMGSCGLAPVVVIDGNVLGNETPESAVSRVRTAVPDLATATAPQEVTP